MSNWLNKIKDFTKKEGAIPILAIAALVVIAIIALILFLVLGKGKGNDNNTPSSAYIPTESYVVDSIAFPESAPESGSEVDFREFLPSNDYSEDYNKVDIEIPEDYFVSSIFELRGNYDKLGYIDQTVKITGVSGSLTQNGIIYHDIYRLVLDDTTGNTQRVGIEYVYDGQYPADGTWVTVTGVLRVFEENGEKYITIDALSVEPVEEGKLYVPIN